MTNLQQSRFVNNIFSNHGTHLNVRTSINMQILKFIFFKNKENNSDCST